jgi:hypothetical protein
MLILFSFPWGKVFERFLMKMDLPPIGIQLQGTLLPFKARAPRVLPSIKVCFDFCLSFPHDTQKNKKLRGHF